ncbi:MAG TPA: inositol monophosphatase [Candidatus Saccharimonadales bacterium]|nr:inositol monophosphatase [Candidatus Saccharimonadales bacterium]
MINVAIDAAKQGGQLAYSYFKKNIKVSYKADNSPVTIADQSTEKLIRSIISKNFPDHGIIGEELPPTNPKAKYQWIIDPIDGTKDFLRQTPFWATLIALLEDGKPQIGVIYYPYSNELFSAQKNKGAYLNGKQVHVSKISKLSDSYISLDTLKYFKRHTKTENVLELMEKIYSQRGMGTFSYNLLLKGNIDAFISAHGFIHDYAAGVVLIEEAGGKFSNFKGEFSLISDNAVYSNGILHDEVLSILNS